MTETTEHERRVLAAINQEEPLTTFSHEELARETRRIRRKRFWGGVRYRARKPFMRLLCVPRRHKRWGHQSMVHAFATGDSKRCRWCNRLVVKKRFREQFQAAHGSQP